MTLDALIVGGGPAGLEAALMLGRACRRVLLLDTAAPRNAAALHSHGFFTRDGAPPAELLRLGRADLAAYPDVAVREARAVSARVGPPGFVVTLGSGEEVAARGLIVACGLRDVLPDVPGLREVWGRGAFFCPYCHGWELRGQPLAVYGTGFYPAHMLVLLRAWTREITWIPDGPADVDAAQRARLLRLGIAIEEAPLRACEGDAHGMVALHLAGGRRIPCRGLLMKPPAVPSVDLLSPLGAALKEDGFPALVDPFHQTTVPGLFVAGDLASPLASILAAAGTGALAAAGLNLALAMAEAGEG